MRPHSRYLKSKDSGSDDDWTTPETEYHPHGSGGANSGFGDEDDMGGFVGDRYAEERDLAAAIAASEAAHGTDLSPSLPPGVTLLDQQEDHDAMMRLLAAQLGRADWADKGKRGGAAGTLSLERRLRDFKFAQGKRRDRYGDERPWGIMGLYDHLQGIRTDVEWAEDAAWRRENDEPYLSWADFEESRNKGLNRPFFTYLALAVCTVMLLASFGANGWKAEPLSVNPMIGPSALTLIDLGAKYTPNIIDDGQWYRLFTPMALHAGLIHYLLNMLALWFIGCAVEQSHGFVAAAIIFIIPATGGTILSAIFLPEYISVGASGGIFGLIGACVADIAINWNLLFSHKVNETDDGTRLRHIKVLLWLLFDILINSLIGLTPFVDNFTHMGGMVYGFLCGLSTMERLPLNFFGVASSGCSRFRNILVRFFGLILSVILIMISTGLLVESDGSTSPCSGCRYVSCVPFPPWADDDNKWWYCDDCHIATGNAVENEDTGYYDMLSLICPNGDIEDVDLTGQKISDKEWLRSQLRNYCRKGCNSLFA